MSDNTGVDLATLEAINEKAIKNEFFTPDKVYIELGLLKDIPIGTLYTDVLRLSDTRARFDAIQQQVLAAMPNYQQRRYDTVDDHFGGFGYSDDRLAAVLADTALHDRVFMVAPTSQFFNLLIRHTIRNQNNSRPANRYVRTDLDDTHFTIDAVPVTYIINTYPLRLSFGVMTQVGQELGEAFGVNIRFLSKNPQHFDEGDWNDWMNDTDCFYFDSLGRFNRGDMVLEKQGNFDFVGRYWYARKRLETCVMADMKGHDYNHEIQLLTSRIDMMCDFQWLTNNDVRLAPEPITKDLSDQE